MYGGWDDFPDGSKQFIEDAIKTGNYEEVYASTNAEERRSKEILIGFEQDYPGVTNESNINDILENLKKKK